MSELLSTGTKIRITGGSHNGLFGTVKAFTEYDDGSVIYDVNVGSEVLTLSETFIRRSDDRELTFFEQVIAGDHGGHGYTGYEVHMEMAQIGSYHPKNKNEPSSKETKSIWVYAEGDRSAPHFHFYSGKDRKAGGCVRLDMSAYFPHDGHNDTLDNQEIKLLVKYLTSTDPDTGLTIWKTIVLFWNRQNSNFKIDSNAAIPPYQDGIQPGKK